MLSDKSNVVRYAPIAFAAWLCCGAVQAQISDTIHPIAVIGYTYDDNLLRLADNVAPGEQRSDRMKSAQAGLLFDRQISRQRLTGRAKVSRVTFEHFDQLDYNGKDFAADWAWQLGNHLNGNVGGTYVETLTSFTDYHSDERNVRTQSSRYGNAAWRFHPSWQVRGSFVRNKFEYELPAQRLNNRTEDVSEAGTDFMAASGSRFGIVARRLEGKYDTPRVVNGQRLDDDYVQDELKANVYWLASGITQVQLLAGYAKRKHDRFTSRDSSGANGRVTVNWAPLGKVRFTAGAWREFAAVESSIITNSLNKGFSVGATWDISAKVQASATARREKRQFEQTSAVIFTGDGDDKLEGNTVTLVWAPLRSVQLSASGFLDKRTGSRLIGSSDYRAKGVSLNASLQF